MRPSTALTGLSLSLLASPALSMPANPKIGSGSAREADPNMFGAYFCTDVNWGGACTWDQRLLGYCVTLGGEWISTISSFGPDTGFTCGLYETTNCNGDSYQMVYPGETDLGVVGWNDRALSFRCLST